jgi:hypothetical protein
LIFLLYIFPGVPQKYYRNTIIWILLTSWILLQIPTDRRILSYWWSDFMAWSRSKEYLDRWTLHLDTRQAREILKNHTGSAILLTDTPWPYFVNFNYELAPRRILWIDALKEWAGQPIILYATRRAEIQWDTLVFSGKTIGKGVFVPFESGGPGGIFLQR